MAQDEPLPLPAAVEELISSLPAQHQDDARTIITTTNLSLDTRLNYLEDYLTVGQLRVCRQLLQEEMCPQQLQEEVILQVEDEEDNGPLLDIMDRLERDMANLRRVVEDEEAGLAQDKRTNEDLQQRRGVEEDWTIQLMRKNDELTRALDVEKESRAQFLASFVLPSPSLQNEISPFPFLQDNNQSTVNVAHNAIQKFKKGEAGKVHSALLLFLPEEKKKDYEEWIQELTTGIPIQLSHLPKEQKAPIMAYFQKNYTPNPELKQRSLEDIIEIAYKILETFLEMKKTAQTTVEQQ